MTGADLLRAVQGTTPLINPRLADVDWDDVAAALASRLRDRVGSLDRYSRRGWQDGAGMAPDQLGAWMFAHDVLAAIEGEP